MITIRSAQRRVLRAAYFLGLFRSELHPRLRAASEKQRLALMQTAIDNAERNGLNGRGVLPRYLQLVARGGEDLLAAAPWAQEILSRPLHSPHDVVADLERELQQRAQWPQPAPQENHA